MDSSLRCARWGYNLWGSLVETHWNFFFPIFMGISHRYSLLRISYVLMSPYWGSMDIVVIGLIWVCRCMWEWTGSRRIGWRSRMLHAGDWELWCRSGLLSLQGIGKIRNLMNKIYLMVQKWLRNLWFHWITWTGSFFKTWTPHQCLLLNNCGSMDSVSLSLSRRQSGNFWWRTCLKYSYRIREILVDSWLGR